MLPGEDVRSVVIVGFIYHIYAKQSCHFVQNLVITIAVQF